jgi:hypothetical protein
MGQVGFSVAVGMITLTSELVGDVYFLNAFLQFVLF